MKAILHNASGTKAVVINSNTEAGPFWANLYVNCNPTFRNSNGLGDITLLRKKSPRLEVVKKWATEQIN